MPNIALNCDCMEYMKSLPDKIFDLALVDAPYGRKEHGGRSRSGYVLQKNGTKLYVSDGHYASKKWDSKPIDNCYFDEIIRVSKEQIVWGVNYYPRVFGSGRIIWDKCNGASDKSDCEIAYNSTTNRVDLFRYMWSGMMQGKSMDEGHVMQGNKQLNEKRIHPTQKPVVLYRWLIMNYAKSGWVLFDPFLGSGSSRIAAYDAGLDFVGCEVDKTYFDLQEERFERHTAQGNLFLMEET